jgi:hypothetical protein
MHGATAYNQSFGALLYTYYFSILFRSLLATRLIANAGEHIDANIKTAISCIFRLLFRLFNGSLDDDVRG